MRWWLLFLALSFHASAQSSFDQERLPLRGVWKTFVEADTGDFMPVLFEIRNTDLFQHNATLYFLSPVRCAVPFRFIGKFGVQYAFERTRPDYESYRFVHGTCDRFGSSKRLELYFLPSGSIRIVSGVPYY